MKNSLFVLHCFSLLVSNSFSMITSLEEKRCAEITAALNKPLKWIERVKSERKLGFNEDNVLQAERFLKNKDKKNFVSLDKRNTDPEKKGTPLRYSSDSINMSNNS